MKKQFSEEASQQWREYGEFLKRLQGKLVFKMEREGKTFYADTTTIKQNATCKLIEQQFSDNTATPKNADVGNVFAVNSNYSFSLGRKTKEKVWTLKELAIGKERKKSQVNANKATDLLGTLVRIGPTDLADLVKLPSFRILQIKKVDHLGREAVWIEFDNTHALEAKPFVPVQGGTMILDPARSWCLRACDVGAKYSSGDTKERFEMTYRDSKSNHPIPVQVVVKSEKLQSGGAGSGLQEWIYDLEEPARPPADGEFTMSAFGLPEPMGMPAVHRGIRWYIWLALAAFASVAIALLFRIVKRRFQAAEPVKN